MNLSIESNPVQMTRTMPQVCADVGYTPAIADGATDPTSPRAIGLGPPHLQNPYVHSNHTNSADLSGRGSDHSSGSGERATPHIPPTPSIHNHIHNHIGSMPGGGLPATITSVGTLPIASALDPLSSSCLPSTSLPGSYLSASLASTNALTMGAAAYGMRPDLMPFNFGPRPGTTAMMPMGRRYPCKLCTAAFDSKAELQIHTQVHMREAKPYRCTHCPKTFANSSYLSQHMRIHLGIKPFGPCQYCHRKFTQLSHLQQHLRTHTGEKPYKCRYPNCEKAFSQLSNLQSHSRCHQSDKPYKCNSCYKCFTDEQSLLDHIPKHKESKHLKVHICPYCGKSYTQATYLAKHMTKHADRRDRDIRIREMGLDTGWPSRDTLGGYGIGEQSSADLTAVNPLSFNPAFPGAATANMMAQTQVTYPSMSATNPSAFTHLAGLTALGNRLGSASTAGRAPYFGYDNYKSAASHTTGLGHTGAPSFHNQLIRLDDIQRYASSQVTMTSQAEQLTNMFGPAAVKRDISY